MMPTSRVLQKLNEIMHMKEISKLQNPFLLHLLPLIPSDADHTK